MHGSAGGENGLRSSNPTADAAMDRYASGDESAFADLYDALGPRLTAFLSRRLRDPGLVADVFQDTMLRIHCARGRFVRGSWVTPWAFAIARRLVLDRARRKQIEYLSHDGQSNLAHPSDTPGPDELVGSHQRGQIVVLEVTRLPKTQREAFELVYYAGMTYAEAAETLGVTVASVKLRVHRANQTIRNAYAVPPEIDS
jgi:RNA polymerase sigma-70 factor (ECF subfamily)